MKKFLTVALVIALTVTLGYGFALAGQDETGNGAPSGPHYNLNIIGVEKDKNADMTGSNRHTIFVRLGTKGGDTSVNTKIYLLNSDLSDDNPFKVCDGNGFDAAYDCNGEEMTGKDGAVFMLPPNSDWNCTWDEQAEEWECTPTALNYYVYARALGAPGGKATITTCAYDSETDDEVCSTDQAIMERLKGKDGKLFTDVTRELTSICYYYDADGNLIFDPEDPNIVGKECLGIFSEEFYDYFWNYDNKGLRLLQLRFYTIPSEE